MLRKEKKVLIKLFKEEYIHLRLDSLFRRNKSKHAMTRSSTVQPLKLTLHFLLYSTLMLVS